MGALAGVLLGVMLATGSVVAEPTDSTSAVRDGRRLATDVFVVGGLTAFYSVVNPSVRRGVFTEGSLAEIARNFRYPIRRAIEGARADQDPFGTNYVAHPLSWGILGFYLKERGYSNWSALIFSQVHSVVWEYVIEGSYQLPSGKDLITNFVGASFAIWVVHDLVGRAARPVTRLAASERTALRAEPDPVSGGVRVGMSVDF